MAITKEEVRELMKDKFVEISNNTYDLCSGIGELEIHTSDGVFYFKPKQKFPIVYESDYETISVDEDGAIKIIDNGFNQSVRLTHEFSLLLLKEAIKKSDEIIKENKK